MTHHLRPVALAATVLLPSLVAAQDLPRPEGLAPLSAKPERTLLDQAHDGRMLEVKFAHGMDVRLRDGHLVGSHPDIAEINAWLDSQAAGKARVFDLDEAWLEDFRIAGEARIDRPLHDLNLFFRIEGAAEGSAAQICDALNAYEVVEIAYPLGDVSDPVVYALPMPGIDTPDFEPNQGYRREAPLGIAADYGNTFSGGIGTGTVIADVETGWTHDHEDIKHKAEDQFVGLGGAPYPWDHGTAVLGELVGEHNEFGVKGLCYDAGVLMSTHQGSASNISTAIGHAAAAVGPGDFVVLEVQCFGGPPGPYPCEYVDSTFAIVENATANGIHVTAAAGNGDNDLDQAAYGGKFDRNQRDSGAIMVGASNGSSLDKASFSNYGTRCDAHGWGFNVTTAGYGDLFGTGTPIYLREYTAGFSGTSSATPIVTGAAVILNGINREDFGSPMDPFVLRDLITNTGTPQGSGGNIGPRPDVRAAIEAMDFSRIDVQGPLTPGSDFDINMNSSATGGAYIIVRSPSVRETPYHIPPYGFLLGDPPFRRVHIGVLDNQGNGTYTGTIDAGAQVGDSVGVFQGWTRYPSGPGTGALTNYIEVVVQ